MHSAADAQRAEKSIGRFPCRSMQLLSGLCSRCAPPGLIAANNIRDLLYHLKYPNILDFEGGRGARLNGAYRERALPKIEYIRKQDTERFTAAKREKEEGRLL